MGAVESTELHRLLDGEITAPLAKANSAFGRLVKRLWNDDGFRSKSTCTLYLAVLDLLCKPPHCVAMKLGHFTANTTTQQ